MSNERKKMVDKMIKLYGFESPITIEFAELCERYSDNEWNDKMLDLLVTAHEEEYENTIGYLDD